jgi:hypothetical protein
MSEKLTRRFFVAMTGGAVVAPSISWATTEVPPMLDHIILGCSDLDKGIAIVEERTGVRAAFGGVHPGRGTRNALLSLGERKYLEILAPDPDQAAPPRFAELTTPQIIGWAARTTDSGDVVKRLRMANVVCNGPNEGSRTRPDGKSLQWKSVTLNDDRRGMLPFYIEWSPDSVHPSTDAPSGCRLLRFVVVSPSPDELGRTLALIGVRVPVERSDKEQLRAKIAGPKGEWDVAS